MVDFPAGPERLTAGYGVVSFGFSQRPVCPRHVLVDQTRPSLDT